MQLLSIAVALGALGFTYALSRSRTGAAGNANVLVVLPLALATPLVALMVCGLQLIYAFRQASAGDGLDALVNGAQRAAETLYVGHLSTIVLLAVLAIVLVSLAVKRPSIVPVEPSPPREESDDSDPSEQRDAERKPMSPRNATVLMAASVLACIAAVAVLTHFEDRFVAAPLAIATAYDDRDVGEFSPQKPVIDEQRRKSSNALVVETFRTLVVAMLFLVLFDAFLVASRAVTLGRGALGVSATLIVIASIVSVRGFYRHQELRRTVDERVQAIAEAKAKAREDEQLESGAVTEGEETLDPSEAEPPGEDQ